MPRHSFWEDIFPNIHLLQLKATTTCPKIAPTYTPLVKQDAEKWMTSKSNWNSELSSSILSHMASCRCRKQELPKFKSATVSRKGTACLSCAKALWFFCCQTHSATGLAATGFDIPHLLILASTLPPSHPLPWQEWLVTGLSSLGIWAALVCTDEMPSAGSAWLCSEPARVFFLSSAEVFVTCSCWSKRRETFCWKYLPAD